MTVLQSIVFGIVEGLTEFVPISSTAHMLLLQHLLSIPPSGDMFAYLVIVQLGAIAALLVYFRHDFWMIAKALLARPFSSAPNRLAWFVILATIPALLAGFFLKDLVKASFGDPLTEAAIRLLTAATLMGIAESLGRRTRALESMAWLDSIVIGLFQVIAVFPGASRSGAAISGGMFRDLDRSSATRFAFLMSAPIMVAAGAYETIGMLQHGALGISLPVLAWGLLASAIMGWLSIHWLIGFVSRHRLYAFAVYCAAIGMGCLVLRSA